MQASGVSSRSHGCRRTRAAVAALSVVAVLVSACGGGGVATSTDALSASIGAEPGNLDPLLFGDGQTLAFDHSVYEGLTARGGEEIVPSLAEEWQLDGTAWVFKLREGVTFHNGQPMTAADVVASWNRALDERSENLGNIVVPGTVVTAVDDRTVSVSRDVADPTTPVRATQVMIVPAEFADPGDSRLSTEMVGTGPYSFEGWTRGDRISLAANPEYWGEQPSLKQVEVLFNDEEAVRLSALQAGEVQMTLNMSSALAKGLNGFKVVDSPVSEVALLRVNTLRGPFTDPRVRQAAAMAIDSETLINELYGGYADQAAGQPIASYVFGFNPELSNVPFNLEGARALLEEAGAAGAQITLMGSRGRFTSDAEVGSAIAAMLEEAGFVVDLQQPPWSAWLEAWFGDGQVAPDLMLANHSNQLFDSSMTASQFLTCEGSASVVCDPAMDTTVETARLEIDETKRQALYGDLWQSVQSENLLVPVADVHRLAFTVENLEWNPQPDGFVRFQDISMQGQDNG